MDPTELQAERIDPTPFHIEIANFIQHKITAGSLRPGYPLPSARDLAFLLHVGYTTVARAYRELQRRGVIDTIVGSGACVAGPKSPSPPLQPEVEAALRHGYAVLRRANRYWIDLLRTTAPYCHPQAAAPPSDPRP